MEIMYLMRRPQCKIFFNNHNLFHNLTFATLLRICINATKIQNFKSQSQLVQLYSKKFLRKIRVNLQIPVSNIRKETVRSLEEEYKLQSK